MRRVATLDGTLRMLNGRFLWCSDPSFAYGVLRFDFLWYEFRYTDPHTLALSKEFYFIPECELPELFYTSLDMHHRLDPVAFGDFHSIMDMEGSWVDFVFRIVQQYPQPRKTSRPSRSSGLITGVGPTVSKLQPQDIRAPGQKLNWFAHKYYTTVMTQCALQKSGLLTVLSPTHPMADFAYSRYRWSEAEQVAFLSRKKPPSTLSHLTPLTPVVLVHIYSKARAGTSRGPILTPAEFQRLDGHGACRLLFFDMFGVEGRDVSSPLIAIPSDDISVPTEDRNRYKANNEKNTRIEYMTRSPLLSQHIHTQHALADYTLSTPGPMIFERPDTTTQWADVWQLLNSCSGTQGFLYPAGTQRSPEKFRVTIQEVHQALADQHASIEFRRQLLDQVDILGDGYGDLGDNDNSVQQDEDVVES